MKHYLDPVLLIDIKFPDDTYKYLSLYMLKGYKNPHRRIFSFVLIAKLTFHKISHMFDVSRAYAHNNVPNLDFKKKHTQHKIWALVNARSASRCLLFEQITIACRMSFFFKKKVVN